MKLLLVDIKDNQREKFYPKNVVQFIGREATTMFVDYNEDLDGAIYMMQENIFKAVMVSLDTYDVDFEVISRHSIKTNLK